MDIYFAWADFNTVPGAPTGFFQGRAIGGGRGQWFGGHHGECGAPAYNGGLGRPPSRVQAKPLVRGTKPPEAESILFIGCPTEPANLVPFQKCICISTVGATVIICEKFCRNPGGQVTPVVPSWGRPCTVPLRDSLHNVTKEWHSLWTC